MNRVIFEGSLSGVQRYDFDWKATQRKLASRVIPYTLMALKTAAPVSKTKEDTGRLRASIGARIEPTLGEGMIIRFVSTAPYAQYVIEGTKSETLITPKTEGVMALRWKDGDGYHFASAVRRKPTKANPFNERVAYTMLPLYQRVFGDSLYLVAV